MTVSSPVSWLLLVFSLPSKRASQRVEIWRCLKRCGALPLGNSGYLLPANPANQEKFEWLAATIRRYKGSASVVQVQAIDDHPQERLVQMFLEARSRDYDSLLREGRTLSASSTRTPAQVSRIRRKLQEVAAIDFFEHPLRSRAEVLLTKLDSADAYDDSPRRRAGKEYRGRTWLTRPRPGIDRCASAWLIVHFIDPHAKFVFPDKPQKHPTAIPFDTFEPGGFGHRGDNCTFETLCKEFRLRDSKLSKLAQMVHDADLNDEKFSYFEALGVDRVLIGWAQQGVPDDELLRRGMEMIDGLYHSIS